MLYGYEICWMNEFYEPAAMDTESGFVGAGSYDDAVRQITDYYCKCGDDVREDLIVSLKVWEEDSPVTVSLIVDGVRDGDYALSMLEKEKIMMDVYGEENGGRG